MISRSPLNKEGCRKNPLPQLGKRIESDEASFEGGWVGGRGGGSWRRRRYCFAHDSEKDKRAAAGGIVRPPLIIFPSLCVHWTLTYNNVPDAAAENQLGLCEEPDLAKESKEGGEKQ